MEREKDGSAYFGAPACGSCASRYQRHAGTSRWECLACSRINYYRVTEDGYVGLSKVTAEEIDEYRRAS
jgi:hypothetical protein